MNRPMASVGVEWPRAALLNTDCAASEACDTNGLCVASGGKCATPVQGDEACLEEFDCTEHGRCSEVDGACIVEDDADCESSFFCSYDGRCTARYGFCFVVDDDDCRRSGFCRGSGMCTEMGGECVATSDEDCRVSSGRDMSARCGLLFGQCSVVDAADSTEGLCAALDNTGANRRGVPGAVGLQRVRVVHRRKRDLHQPPDGALAAARAAHEPALSERRRGR